MAGILDYFSQKMQQRPPAQPALGGMSGQAQQVMQSRAWQLYAQEKQAMGQPPDMNEFMQLMRQQTGAMPSQRDFQR